MTRSAACRRYLLQHRRGAVRSAPSPPYIWFAVGVVVLLAAYQWYAQYNEDREAAEKQNKPVAKNTKHDEPASHPAPPAKTTPAKTKPRPKFDVLGDPIPSEESTDKDSAPERPVKSTATKQPGGKQPAGKPAQPDEPEPSNNPNAGKYRVTHIADGDTMNLEGKHRVRLIGIDCPEIAHPERDPPAKAQPWSTEAMKFTEARLKNQTVRVEFDPEYDAEDHYGRWLCWVYYRDQRDGSEKLLNEELLRAGLAFAYDDRRKFHYTEAMYRRLKAAQRGAQEEKRGIYSK